MNGLFRQTLLAELQRRLERAEANERHLTNLLDWRTKERDALAKTERDGERGRA